MALRSRARGMTLVELMIAMALALILVGTAAFVFITSQKIMSRVDTRLRAAQSFRVTSTILDRDGARIENMFYWSSATAINLRKMSTGEPWLQIRQVPGAAGPETRQDVVKFVTHANVSIVVGGNIQPPSDQTVLVTYQLKPGRGLVRTLDLVTLSGGAAFSQITATIDDTTLPQNQGTGLTGGLDMDIAPGATGFSVRYCMGGQWSPPSAAGGNTDTGTPNAFLTLGLMPSGLEFTVYIPENPNLPESTRLSIVRAVELLPPPP